MLAHSQTGPGRASLLLPCPILTSGLQTRLIRSGLRSDWTDFGRFLVVADLALIMALVGQWPYLPFASACLTQALVLAGLEPWP